MNELGASIRNVRKQRGMTLKQLADSANLSVAFISKVERGVTNPSFKSLQSICYALGITTTELVKPPILDVMDSMIIRKHDRQLIYDYSNVIKYEAIFNNSPYFSFDVLTISGSNKEFSSSCHSHDEFGIIVKGKLKIIINDNTYILEEGDGILIKAGVQHQIQKYSDSESISYWIKMYGLDEEAKYPDSETV